MGETETTGRRCRKAAGRLRPLGAAPRRRPYSSALVFALLPLAGAACDVAWGGARVALEDPAPPPPEREVREADAEEVAIPLPDGPFLYAVRVGPAGAVLVTPVAALPPGGGPPMSLGLPDPLTPDYRARFDSTFLAPGTELALQRWGRRIGSVVLRGGRPPSDAGCPSVAEGSLLLLPGQDAPRTSIALPQELSPAIPEPAGTIVPPRGMTIAAPVIAERLIGDDRAYLARLVSLQAIRVAGDAGPAMAATYLIDDSLAAGPPGGDAVSLFFLSTPDPERGYITRWNEVRRYAAPGRKEAYEYLDWAGTPAGGLHVLRLFDGSSVRLAAAFGLEWGDEALSDRVEWREGERCPALERLGG